MVDELCGTPIDPAASKKEYDCRALVGALVVDGGKEMKVEPRILSALIQKFRCTVKLKFSVRGCGLVGLCGPAGQQQRKHSKVNI